MSEGEVNAWATHQPVLMAAIAATKGPVLEAGVGHNSTVLLHAACAPTQRPVLSLDGNAEWLDKFKDLECHWHHLQHVPNWADPPISDTRWSVVFVDHDCIPRGTLVSQLRDYAELVVMHDSECGYPGYTAPLERFDWVWTFTRYDQAWTTIAGMGLCPRWVEELKPGIPGVFKAWR